MLYKRATKYNTSEKFLTNTVVSIEHQLCEDIRNKVNKFQGLDLYA